MSENDLPRIVVAEGQDVDGDAVGGGDAGGLSDVAEGLVAVAHDEDARGGFGRSDGHAELDAGGQVGLLAGQARDALMDLRVAAREFFDDGRLGHVDDREAVFLGLAG